MDDGFCRRPFFLSLNLRKVYYDSETLKLSQNFYCALVVGLLVCATTTRAVTYVEVGDAGQLRNTAQPTAANQAGANQSLTAITGGLLSATDIDLFIINIANPAAFSASTVNGATGFLDTALFLFDSNGRPVYANDDDPNNTMSLGSSLPAGNPLGPQVAGLYYLAVSFSGAEPVNLSNVLLFTMAITSTDIRGPNPSASGPLAGWDTSGIFGGGTFPAPYQIDLTGATTAAVPEPSILALASVGIAGLLGLKRKRRQRS